MLRYAIQCQLHLLLEKLMQTCLINISCLVGRDHVIMTAQDPQKSCKNEIFPLMGGDGCGFEWRWWWRCGVEEDEDELLFYFMEGRIIIFWRWRWDRIRSGQALPRKAKSESVLAAVLWFVVVWFGVISFKEEVTVLVTWQDHDQDDDIDANL